MSYMSLTAQVSPASGPVAAPAMGATRSCGTKAEREWEESGIIAPELAHLTLAALVLAARSASRDPRFRLSRCALRRNDAKKMTFSAPGGPGPPNTACAARV